MDYDIVSVSNDTKQIEAAWYTRKIWHTVRISCVDVLTMCHSLNYSELQKDLLFDFYVQKQIVFCH